MKRSLFAIFVITVISISAQAKYSGGAGTSDDPYQIASADDLLALGADTNDYNKCFIQTNDIDLDPNLSGKKVFTTAVIAPDTSNSSPDFQGAAFNGVFDGTGHKISNLTVNTIGTGNSYLGLFGYVSGGEIKNLGIENVSITNENEAVFIGGLAGQSNGAISNCYSTGNISGDLSCQIGGLVGNNGGSISNCYSTGNINGRNSTCQLGGLVGYSSGDIYDCNATGTVKGGDSSMELGGLAGYTDGKVSHCFSTGSTINGNLSSYTGGLVGMAYGSINDCYASGNITGGDNSQQLGGLVGYTEGDVNRCFATGDVTGGFDSHWLGGLVAYALNDIKDSFATGDVVGGDSSAVYGGLVGVTTHRIDRCFSTGSITTGSNSQYLGGLLGATGGSVSDCYSTGNVTSGNASETIGGLVGSLGNGVINNCYSTGIVSSGAYSYQLGGLVGYDFQGDGKVYNCFFLATSGPDNNLGEPLTNEQMKQQTSFVGWDFTGETADGPNDIWTICEGVDYPKLAWYFNGKYPLVISKCAVKSGHTDSISISGFIGATADDLNNSSIIVVSIDSDDMNMPCILTFPADGNTFQKGKFNYSGTEEGIKKTLRINTRSHKFFFSAKKLDLSGLSNPVTIYIEIGNYIGKAEINEEIINGRRPTPIKLLMGIKDAMRIDRVRVRRRSTDRLSIKGGFAVENTDVNMVDVPLSITLDSQTFTTPAGSFKAGNNKFKCSNVIIEGGIASARFNYRKGTFWLAIRNSTITAESGDCDFRMEFGDFSEIKEVTLP
ncbi:MAG: hypothetical protein JW749_12420 [Sedimentisphaerales bacterium]|nr:hypothetical protein [Sedimentisphaerales bacterium]